MSYGEAYSSLYVICKNEQQQRELMTLFEHEKPLDSFYCLERWNAGDLKVHLELNGNDAPVNLDDEILSFAQWLQEKFGLELQGFWEFGAEGSLWRCEVHDGRVEDACLDWLVGYSVTQIEELRKYAEAHFKA